MSTKRELAVAKAQHELQLEALEGKWEDAPIREVHQLYLESAKVGLAAADELLFSDATVLKVAKTLLMHTVSDNAGETAPEIMEKCESAARAVLATLKRIVND